MEENESINHRKEKKQSNNSGFIAYAIFVFSALALGLVVILMRSN